MDSEFKKLLAGANWAATGDRTDPSADPNLSRATGWPPAFSSTTAPQRTLINQLLRELYGAARESALGVSQYDAEVTYPVGAVCQVNGRLYYAAQANSPTNPVSPVALNNTAWTEMGGIGDAPSPPSAISAGAMFIDGTLADRFAVYWNEPSNGNSPITSVDLRYSKDSTFPTGAATHTISNYQAGTAVTANITARDSDLFYVSLRFNNAVSDTSGGAVWSVGKQVRTTALSPDAPVGLRATASGASGSVNLVWGAPYARGLSISSYLIQWKSGTQSYSTSTRNMSVTGTSQLITGLTNNTAHQFQITARSNRSTSSPASAEASATPVKPDVPTAPAITAEASGYSSIQAYLSSIPNNGGTKISRFHWQLKRAGNSWTGNSVTTTSTEEPYNEFTGLIAGESYDVRCRAYNGADDADSDPETGDSGFSGWSTSFNVSTLAFTTPDAPQITGLRPVPWNVIYYGLTDDIADNGGSEITTYDLDYRISTDTNWTELRGLSDSFGTLIGIPENETGTYQIRMRASNGTFKSEWSNTANITRSTAPVPGKPQVYLNYYLLPNRDDAFIATMSTPFVIGGLTSFEFNYRADVNNVWTSSGTLNRPFFRNVYAFTSLPAGTSYQVRARARGPAGWSPWSDIVSHTIA